MQKVKELKELILPVGNATRAGTAREKTTAAVFAYFFGFCFFKPPYHHERGTDRHDDILYGID